jgi:hypothetical protein
MPEMPGPDAFDPDGRYHEFKTDAWGTRWEYRIFGIWGHPIERPLDDWANMDNYMPPVTPPCSGNEFEQEKSRIAVEKREYFTLGHGGLLFEILHSIRRFEDVLMDLAMDDENLNRLADMIVDHNAKLIEYAIALGVDGVCFGDDFGTEQQLMFSPKQWDNFFGKRYDKLFSPLRTANIPILFHSCGAISQLLPKMRNLGVNVIWPQLPVFDLTELAAMTKDLGLAIELHPDRGHLMQRGTPDQIRFYIHNLVKAFKTDQGGSWLYIEIDPGFPWENVKALFETAMELRS